MKKFINCSMVRYAKLSLPFDAKAVQNELLSVNEEWQAHFNIAHYQGAWTVLALRSPSGDHKNIIPELQVHSEYRDTAYMEYFPAVKKLVSAINCPVMAVRFLNLQAGAFIKQHRDNELAFEKGEARLHFPIITNPGVEFYIEDDRILLNEGECWYINANLPHRVCNQGLIDRIHLVIDCKVNNWLKDVITSSAEISHKEEKTDPALLKMMIAQLRGHNTETAGKMADDMELQLKAAHG
ncbi:MAG: aspartyl/asparaginyl beta-hydroxylase domain-containing protein [Candidatus Saccharimonadales bacterium]